MKYFEKSCRVLEYDKVLQRIAQLARTEGAAERMLQTVPEDDIYVIKRLQEETRRAKVFIGQKSSPSFGHIKNIVPAVERAVKGATLTTRELLDISALLRAVTAVKKYPSQNDDTGVLTDYFNALGEINHLENAITNAIAAEDMITDTASDELYRIRRDIRKCESGLRDTLNKFTTGTYSKYLQESIITIRGGRYVVPVKAEHKNEIKGLVHDTSASGATLFIEPLAVLEQNNRLRELAVKEENEIQRILFDLSQKTAAQAETLNRNYEVLTDLAVIFARAEYALDINGTIPLINENKNEINLISARHPLLEKSKVVPISVKFGDKNRILVITGPNTGGKTVTLKTIGLFCLMAQSGIQIPCENGSSLPVFDGVLPDIGDEQSIEQSLSTFSSHMVNIVKIMETVTSKSLCLFDELGAGTDPTEGAALAISILEEIKQRGAVAAATTHYAELKSYALDSEGVVNASCEFDVETLKPTYRLIIGIPGKSNAFAISQRLGLPEKIIIRAQSVMSDENIKFEDIISRLEETESKLTKEKELSEKLKTQTELLYNEAKKQKENTEKEIQKKLEKAQEQVIRMIASAKASSDFIFDELNELKRKAEKEKSFDDLEATRKAIRNILKETSVSLPEDEDEDDDISAGSFEKGDEVYIKTLKTKGIITDIKDNTAYITTGNIKTKTPTTNLRSVREPKQQVKQTSTIYSSNARVKNEIDVRGETGDDAWYLIDRYLDSAIISGHEAITIIHGKGTGALRGAITRYLKNDPRIKASRSGRYGEGDLGVTIVELKN